MKNSIFYNIFLITILLFVSLKVFAKDFIIEGNEFTDDNIVISIIGKIPNTDEQTKSNFILKQLNSSGLFKAVEISYDDNFFYLKVVEFSSINKFFFDNNQRIKDDEIDSIVKQLDINTLSEKNINNLIDELKKIYQAFGYNNIQIEYKIERFSNNSANIYLNFQEGNITKIKSINIIGNNNFKSNILLSKIVSKTKKITNIFANNNFKLYQIENDSIKILNFYKSKGYKDVKVSFNVEYFSNNKAVINFIIDEGNKYFISKFNVNNNLKSNEIIESKLNILIEFNNSIIDNLYNISNLNELELGISNILENEGIQYYQIKSYEKFIDYQADILIEITPTETTYVNQINLSGNTRTYD